MIKNNWHKRFMSWKKDKTLYISIIFTWDLPEVKRILKQKLFQEPTIIGGPAVYLMPDYFNSFSNIRIGNNMPGMLQKFNPLATRTTIGCIRNCDFCGVRKTEGYFKELKDWPDLPIICDNNILAASINHLNKVFDRLEKHNNVDFNQGIDCRLMNEYHARRIARIKALTRLALDNKGQMDDWEKAYSLLRRAGLKKKYIRSYAIIGYNDTPENAWDRCNWIEEHKIKALPMWYHDLNQTKKNVVTEKQKGMGWTDYERKKIMGWFYQHRSI